MGHIFANKIDSNGWLYKKQTNIIFVFEFVVHEPFNDGRLARGRIPKQYDLIGFFANGWTGYGHLIIFRRFYYNIW